jgi:hypothetical protein
VKPSDYVSAVAAMPFLPFIPIYPHARTTVFETVSTNSFRFLFGFFRDNGSKPLHCALQVRLNRCPWQIDTVEVRRSDAKRAATSNANISGFWKLSQG